MYYIIILIIKHFGHVTNDQEKYCHSKGIRVKILNKKKRKTTTEPTTQLLINGF